MLDIKIYDESNNENAPVILLNVFDMESSKSINNEIKRMVVKPYILICLTSKNIECYLRPWKIDKNDAMADSYLSGIASILKDYKNRDIYIMGYSLAGLFALYSLYKVNTFKRVGVISGSLWYPNILDFVLNNKLLSNIDKAYFSVGDLESKGKNKLFSSVLDNTLIISDLFLKNGINTKFELNSGNHFTDMELRITKGLLYLLED